MQMEFQFRSRYFFMTRCRDAACSRDCTHFRNALSSPLVPFGSLGTGEWNFLSKGIGWQQFFSHGFCLLLSPQPSPAPTLIQFKCRQIFWKKSDRRYYATCRDIRHWFTLHTHWLIEPFHPLCDWLSINCREREHTRASPCIALYDFR